MRKHHNAHVDPPLEGCAQQCHRHKGNKEVPCVPAITAQQQYQHRNDRRGGHGRDPSPRDPPLSQRQPGLMLLLVPLEGDGNPQVTCRVLDRERLEPKEPGAA